PGSADHPRPPVLPLAGRGAGGGDPQAERVHRPLRLVAEVLPAAARPLREHVAEGEGAVRFRLPGDRPRPMAGRLRHARHHAGGAAVDPEGERGPAAPTGQGLIVRNRGIGSWVARRARMTPHQLAVVHDSTTLTYA